ncbi:DUF262 domain-containing protein [Kineothrix sedimenti]|uniref:DUF262 domain-containing protein n=1 Tax=Kineothrix sedimenti TaxID=3123317 RepID=A0ABZ3EX15_9FIRM
MSIDNLIEDVDNQIIQIRTKSLDVSFNELYDMYTDGELVISPDYQRLFRWDEEKQSRFIESLLLEMPVPPIFVIEVNDGVYELIDGLQRISSYLHFRGEKLGKTEDEFLELKGCDIVPDLDGVTYDRLPKALQIKIKRSFVRMEVIRKESESSLKYHMFKRLNTGGELLSAQEIRNCTIRLLNSNALDFIEKCSANDNFKSVIQKINEEEISKKYDQELVLRFFAVKNDISNYKYPVTEFLTRYLEKITNGLSDFNYREEEELFSKTFKFIADNLGEDIFSSKTKNGNMKNDFVTYLYDGITIAIAELIEDIEKINMPTLVVDKINAIKYGEELQSYKTGSINGVTKRISLFKVGVEEIIDDRGIKSGS